MRPLLLAVLLAVVVGGTAEAATIVYQCGPSVCAVDPDAKSPKPRVVTEQGRLAGITRDGATVSWVPPGGGLVQAPVAGGAARQVYDRPVVNQPSMSPDGTRYLWSYPGPDGWGGLNAIWVNRYTVRQPEPDGVSFCSFCVTTHGWLGTTAIAAFPAETRPGEPSMVCRLASTTEEPGVSASCVEVLVGDARGGIGFPSGNAAGTELVAVLTPGERTGIRGRIVRYSLASGGPIADVTEGTDDTTPMFSPAGDRVAFERSGQIVVKDLQSGAERMLAAGVYPFWGGARAAGGAAIRSRSLRYRRGRIRVKLRCAGTEPCRGVLRLKRRSTTLGTRAYRIAAGKGATVAVTPSRRGRRALAKARRHRVTVLLKPSNGKTTRRKLTLRR